MKVKDVMATTIVTVTPKSSFKTIWTTLFHKHINALPVVDDKKKLIGIISKEDLLQSLYPEYTDMLEFLLSENDFESMENTMKEMFSRTGKDFMRTDVIVAYDDTPAMRALSRMISHRVNQLPVLTSDNEVIGIVTKGDIFSALFRKHLGRVRKKLTK
jgi:CBS-domain-containing membrane protein